MFRSYFFKKPIIFCKTLRDILVKSALKSTRRTFLTHRFFQYNRHNCSTSKHSSFHSNHITKTFNIRGYIICNCTNLIYIITCSKCQKQYVGKTGRKLKTRITEHLRKICEHTNTIICPHFNTTDHSIEHTQVNTIEQGSATPGTRDVIR